MSSISLDSQAGFQQLSNRYKYYVLLILWFVALFRLVDLQIIAVLLESIKSEFQLTDTQLGLLSGFAFALFYGLLGIPVAWLADRYSRRNIISIAVGLWSFMTVMCGMVTSYFTLFLARMGVGIGEAGGYPPTTSLLTDYFSEKQRGLVFSILGSAVPMGVLVGFLIGGVVNELYGWRAAYFIVGVPGIFLALLVRYTVRELPRGFSDHQHTPIQPPNIIKTFVELWAIKSYRYVVIGACMFTLGAYGSGIWIPSFFIRVHSMSSIDVGLWMAGLYGGGGLLGTMLGGTLGDVMYKRTNCFSWYMRIPSIAMALTLPFSCFVYLWPNPKQALMVHLFVTIFMHMNIGPVLAMVQKLSGVEKRSMGQAINVLVTNLVALSLGPLIVGMLSDYLTPITGNWALGYSILGLVIIAYSLSSLAFLRAAKWIPSEANMP